MSHPPLGTEIHCPSGTPCQHETSLKLRRLLLYLTAISCISIYGCCLLSHPYVSLRIFFCCPYTLPLDAAEKSNICLLLSFQAGRSLIPCTCSHTVCPRSSNLSTKYNPTLLFLQSKHKAKLQSRTALCYKNSFSMCSQHPTTFFQTAATYHQL